MARVKITIAETGTVYQAAFTAATQIACGTMQMMRAFDYGRKVFIGSDRESGTHAGARNLVRFALR
jgi:hypothetical protein